MLKGALLLSVSLLEALDGAERVSLWWKQVDCRDGDLVSSLPYGDQLVKWGATALMATRELNQAAN